ncbi:MAG: nucleotide pyrophosphohydrolase [Waddliaceae bacterium]|nr:nucleotide pyrophosphohydrolase [Waddliaceae bacterium]
MQELIDKIRQFNQDRDWDQFHDCKSLSMALMSEAGELGSILRWIPQDQADAFAKERIEEVSAEVADVFWLLIQLSDRLGIDLIEATKHKIDQTAQRYPIEKAKASPLSYKELE